MTQDLHDYFSKHAEQAIKGMKDALIAENFYKRLEMRLAKGEDLSAEVPVIAKVGQAGALKVTQEAIAENKELETAVWNFPAKVQELGKVELSMRKEPFEHLPRVTQIFRYKCDAGAVTVQIETAGENFTVSFATVKNKMAAKMSLQEFGKDLSFALLTTQNDETINGIKS